MVAEAEVWVFVTAIIFIIVGITGNVAKRISSREFRVFKYLTVTGVIGILLIPVSIIVAIIRGRVGEFLNTMFSSPLHLISSIGTGQSYSAGCVEGHCAIYCCQDPRNSGIRWKDCNKDCMSVKGIAGVNTGDDCQLSEREMHCKDTGTGGTIISSQQSCNNLTELGPITCTCCHSQDSGLWWDCLPNCMSDPALSTGFTLNNQSCIGITRKYCNQKVN